MSNQFSIDFDLSELTKGFEELGKAVFEAVQKGLFLGGEAWRADSVMIIPFDKGFNGGLAGSGSVQTPEDEGGGIHSVTLGFNMPYAARMHEDMSLKIKQTNTVAGQTRQQKYVEKPGKENAEKYGSIIHEQIASALT